MKEKFGQELSVSFKTFFMLIKSKLKTFLILSMIFLLVLSLSIFVFKYFQLKKTADNQKYEPKDTKTAFDYKEIPENVESEIQNILSGQVEFKDKRDEVPYYSSTFNLPDEILLCFEVFKYTPGAKYEAGYEGFKWTVNLDEIVSELNKLKVGKQIASFIENPPFPWESSQTEITCKQLGNNKWMIYESSFPPSATDQRFYWSYNPETKLLINMVLLMPYGKRGRFVECYKREVLGKYDECHTTFVYSEELQQVVDNIEYFLVDFGQ